MKILISCLNSQYIHSSLAPWCLLAGIKAYTDFGSSTALHEGTVNEKAEKNISDIVSEKPDILGICSYIWNIKRIREILPSIRAELPDTAIILGGPEVSYDQAQCLKEIPEADYIISGEGEKPFALLCKAIAEKKEIPEGLGISGRVGEKIFIAEPYISTEEPPSPYCEEYFARLNGRISYIETSRGCPFSCAFCLSGRCGSARFFELSDSLKALESLANSGTKTVKFVDRTFNANEKRAAEIIRFISDNYGGRIPEGVCFHFEIAGDILSDNLIALLNSAPKGSIQLEIGMQSFNEKTLKAIDRKTNTERLKRNIEKLVASGNLHIHIDLIAGLPFEGMKSFRESFNTGFELKANMLQMGFLKILHGAPMDTESERFPCTYSVEPPYEVSSTPWLSPEDIASLHLTENALDRLWCSGRFRDTVIYLMGKTEKTAFDFFTEAGKMLKDIKTPSDICKILMENMGSEELRDVLVKDWMSSNSSGRLPEALVRHDPELKRFIVSLESDKSTARAKGVKRSAAILYSFNKYVYVDYVAEHRDPVTGRYPLIFAKRNGL